MPAPVLKAWSKKYGVSLAALEGWWAEARKQYGDDFAAVTGTVKKRLRNHVKGRGRHLAPA
jgi:hypothetical protein